MKSLILLLLFLSNAQAESLESTGSLPTGNTFSSEDDTIYVIGSKEKAFYTPGSAHFIDKKELETFNYKDVSRILDKVPGVYIQEEDGLGLRPNIGLRGAHPHRSKKITLLEDGILVGPAPYSAPAAYYFPNTNRIDTMEVFKGASSVKYGPNSIGGAINMVTPISGKVNKSEVDVSVGLANNYIVINSGRYADSAWYVSANRKDGKLVRTIKDSDDPEFEQNDFLIKYSEKIGKGKADFKISYSDEESQESYLGTTPDDFNSNPFERYAASQDALMDWSRVAGSVSWSQSLNSITKTKMTLYHNAMKRNWSKFSEMAGGQDFRSALRLDNNDSLIALLKGERDSIDASENLIYGANDREYFSQGIQTWISFEQEWGSVYHDLELGLRYHRDQVERNHTEIEAAMISGDLIFQPSTLKDANQNRDTSNAITIFLNDEMSVGDLTVNAGARLERIKTQREPRVTGKQIQTNEDTILVPGLGVNYSLSQNIVTLAGVNKGVTIVGPGQDDRIEPEEAINYEAGIRVKAPIYLEAIAFYSDYKNIKGTCTFSGGCNDFNLDKEFNGGEAEIFGLESLVSYDVRAGKMNLPLKAVYTFTTARFSQDTTSDNPEWGIGQIRTGDPLPYVPQHQISLGSGLEYKNIAWNLNMVWKSRMADQAVAENRQFIPSYGVFDTAFSWKYSNKGKSYLRINNLLDNNYLASLRPFGARPAAPRTVSVGLNQSF
jgi:Fe(3+) dicitrate transport protein